MDTIAACAARAAHLYPDRPALVEGDVVLTYRDYVGRARDVARGLLGAGVGAGERVATWAPNSIEHAVAILGTHLAGAVLVPVNARFRVGEAAQVLDDANARVLLTVEEFLGRRYAEEMTGHQAGHPAPPRVLVLDRAGPGSVDALGAGAAGAAEIDDVVAGTGPDDVAIVLFTSGTTGRPKGAMLRHGALVRGYRDWAELTGLRTGDRVLLSNPFFHAFGLNAGLLCALLVGATVYPVPVFRAQDVADLVVREAITWFPAPPTVFADLADLVRSGRAPAPTSLRVAVTGATVIPRRVVTDLHDVLGVQTVHVPYGFTEGTALATVTRADDDREAVLETVGRPLPGIEVTVERPDGSTCEPGEVGEVVVRGHALMAGYLDPARRGPLRATELPGVPPGAGLRSGDLGTVDAEGRLRIVGRIKDVVIVGGFNVYPAEVERFLCEHPAVAQAAVVGRPDRRLGEVVAAFVVPRPGCTPDPAELITWCRERFANFKVPRAVRVLDALPTNATGKVTKAALRDLDVPVPTPGESEPVHGH